MYNRYVPQPDGSFRRSQVPESNRRPQQQAPQTPKRAPCQPQQPPRPQQEEPKREASAPPCQEHRPPRQDERPNPTSCRQGGNVGSFFRNLLPKDFDTCDLVVVLLLLLMAGDCDEDKNTALLTLVLYLFM